MPALYWLPKHPSWREALDSARRLPPFDAISSLTKLANYSLDFVQTEKLDRAALSCIGGCPAHPFQDRAVRLAVLGSSTLKHLSSGIRIAALRRGFWIELFEGEYGTYYQELADPNSALRAFSPQFVLLALDAQHLAGTNPSVNASMQLLQSCWSSAKELGATVIQQTVMPVEPSLLGNNDHRLTSSPAAFVTALNAELRQKTVEAGVELLALDSLVVPDGLAAWHDRTLWYHAKQEVHPRMAPEYGDHVARIVAACRGRSAKCLVLDLDNTLWGGVVGDDGLNGIVLGQGSAIGEAHLALQRYAKGLAARGCILAVCSKNDEQVAREVFERHPEMLLRLPDIASFVANWSDKAQNLRTIAESLNIGLDSLVFVDDNPFERDLVRRELPMVAVPELPPDPALYVSCLAAAGYFEATTVTAEDVERTQQYQQNARRDELRASCTDVTAYLRELDMELECGSFTPESVARVTQLINKTNQFNLTTHRYGQADVEGLLDDPGALTLQFRLRDRFGDNGLIAVVIGVRNGTAIELDTWLMSCRVLGRKVEQATLSVIATQARSMGADRLIGTYLPTAKNGMVKDHYPKLGFDELETLATGAARWSLPLDRLVTMPEFIRIRGGAAHAE
jgi:FkbH-like protein